MSLELTCLQAKAAASTVGPSASGNQTQEVNNNQGSQRGQGDNDEIHNNEDPLSLLGGGDPGADSYPCAAIPQRQKSLPFKPQLPRPRSNLFNNLLRSQGDDQDVQGDNDGGDVDKFGYPSNRSTRAAALCYPGGYVPADEASGTTLCMPSSLAQHTDSCHSHCGAAPAPDNFSTNAASSSGLHPPEIVITDTSSKQCEVQGEVIHWSPTLKRTLKLGMAYVSMHWGNSRGGLATDNAHKPQPTMFYPPQTASPPAPSCASPQGPSCRLPPAAPKHIPVQESQLSTLRPIQLSGSFVGMHMGKGKN
ncbi:hypothetical protein BT96DRAFT_947888 [Gymnopus androsaceus JB14]|uniref:Uncharacterized protein n=1 Tax=Gymnopus androsaceus JB14 TaxID=1447944 RepID=A0A6A4GSC9_9AGAR|nr:hypothetical protein BT96DRAFT_947888 [Gymnopus androsaceus JB14]